MDNFSRYSWGWIVRVVALALLFGFLFIRWNYPNFAPELVIIGFALLYAGIGQIVLVAKRKGLHTCPSCSLNTSFMNGDDGYKPSLAFLPQRSCSRCGEDFSVPLK